MFRKIFFYVFISLGIFVIISAFATYFAFGESIEETLFIALGGLIPIFIALISRACDDIANRK